MATNHNDEYEMLRNRSVDYDRTDLGPRGILGFLIGLLIAGIFIELVIWGMFRFLSRSPFFAKGNQSPMVTTQKAPPLSAEGKDFENTSNINPGLFPEPRLQTNDVVDMQKLLERERKILYTREPFQDSTGTVHLPIDEAMQLIVERGLPVKPAGNAATTVTQKTVPAKATAAPGTE